MMKNMKNVKSGDRQRSHRCAAPQEQSEAFPNDGHLPGDIRADGAGKIRLLIPRQEVSGERHPQDKKRERAARDPEKLAFPFVGPVEKRLQKMQEQNDEHGT